jgi:hypothetical protein
MFRKILCSLGDHDWQTIQATSCFRTEWTNGTTMHHMVWYQQCSCCKKRRLKDTVKQDSLYGSRRHNGVELARVDWVERGTMYLGSGKSISTPVIPIKKKPRLTVIKGKD